MLKSLETQRRRSARTLAVALQAQAIVAGAALGFFVSVELIGPFSYGLVAAGAIVLAILSAFAAMLEWNREPLGEAFSLSAGVIGFGLAIVAGFAGLWFVAPVQAVASFAVWFALAERYMTRNEERHQPLEF